MQFILALFILLSLLPLSAQRPNLEIIDSLVSEQLTLVAQSSTQNAFSEIPVSGYTGESYLMGALSSHNLTSLAPISAEASDRLHFEWSSQPLAYQWEAESGDIIRIFQTDIMLTRKDSSGVSVALYPIKGLEYRDTVPENMLLFLGQSPYPFTSPAAPPPPSSLWDTVLEPVAVIGSAVLSIWLLFSIRS